MSTDNSNPLSVKNVSDCTVCEAGTYQTVDQDPLCPGCQDPIKDVVVPESLQRRRLMATDVTHRFLDRIHELGEWYGWMVYTASAEELAPFQPLCDGYDVPTTSGTVCFTTDVYQVLPNRYFLGICAQTTSTGLYDRYVDLKTEIRGDPHDTGWSE